MEWSAEDRVASMRRTVLAYRASRSEPYRSPVAAALRFDGQPGDLPAAFDIFSTLAEPYRLDSSLFFSSVRGMSVAPEPRCGIDGMVAVDVELSPYRAMRKFLADLELIPGLPLALRAADDATMRGLRGMASDVLADLGDTPGLDEGVFSRLWDSDDLIGSSQDAWEPSDKVGPLLCRDVLGVELGTDPEFVPVSPRHDEVGNFPLRLVYNHAEAKVGFKLHFLTRVALVPAADTGHYPDRCRLDMPRDGLPVTVGG